MSRDQAADRLQATIDRLALELTNEQAAHRRTADRLAHMEARARAWRRVARWIYEAHRPEE